MYNRINEKAAAMVTTFLNEYQENSAGDSRNSGMLARDFKVNIFCQLFHYTFLSKAAKALLFIW